MLLAVERWNVIMKIASRSNLGGLCCECLCGVLEIGEGLNLSEGFSAYLTHGIAGFVLVVRGKQLFKACFAEGMPTLLNLIRFCHAMW